MRWLRLFVLAACLPFLAGCFAQEVGTNLEADGSGSLTIDVGFASAFLDLSGFAGSSEIDDLFAEFETMVSEFPAAWDVQVVTWASADGQFSGRRLTMDFADPEMLIAQLNALNELEMSFVRFEDVAVETVNNMLVFRGVMVLSDELSGATMDDFGMSGLGLGMVEPRATWSITLPGEIEEWSLGEYATLSEDQHTVAYVFPLLSGGSYAIEVRGASTTGLPVARWLLAAGLGVIGLGLVMMGLQARRRRLLVPAYAPAPTGQFVPPMAPIAPVPRQESFAPPAPRQEPPPLAARQEPLSPAQGFENPVRPATPPLGSTLFDPPPRERDS